jgi:hypothetical protein
VEVVVMLSRRVQISEPSLLMIKESMNLLVKKSKKLLMKANLRMLPKMMVSLHVNLREVLPLL